MASEISKLKKQVKKKVAEIERLKGQITKMAMKTPEVVGQQIQVRNMSLQAEQSFQNLVSTTLENIQKMKDMGEKDKRLTDPISALGKMGLEVFIEDREKGKKKEAKDNVQE